MTNLMIMRDVPDRSTTYMFRVHDDDLIDLQLDQIDLALLRDCGGNDSTIADKALALQTILFRMEQQQKSKLGERK